MTIEAMKIHEGDEVILNDGMYGKVINLWNGQQWDRDASKLYDIKVLEIDTPCGVEEVTNEDVAEVI